MIWVLLQLELPLQRNDAITFLFISFSLFGGVYKAVLYMFRT